MTAVSPSKIASLRQELATAPLSPYRYLDGKEKAWEDSPAGTDYSLKRFLMARKGDVQEAKKMFIEHLTWRRRCFPIYREGKVAQILDEENRFRVACSSGDGRQVLMMHFQWGYFYKNGFKAEDCLLAALWLAETEISKSEEMGAHDAYMLLYGGPPPIDFAMALQMVFEANYPERLYRAVIYPVPGMVARFVKMMCWFLDKDTASKISIESSEEVLLKIMNIRVEQLPAFVQGGLEVTEQQFERDSPQRMRTILWDGIKGNGKARAAEVTANILRPLHEMVPAKVDPPASMSFFESLLCCVGREPVREKKPVALVEPTPISLQRHTDAKTSESVDPKWCRIICGFAMLNLTFVLLLLSMAELWRCGSVGDCKPLAMSLFENMLDLQDEVKEL